MAITEPNKTQWDKARSVYMARDQNLSVLGNVKGDLVCAKTFPGRHNTPLLIPDWKPTAGQSTDSTNVQVSEPSEFYSGSLQEQKWLKVTAASTHPNQAWVNDCSLKGGNQEYTAEPADFSNARKVSIQALSWCKPLPSYLADSNAVGID